ncbi:MAG: hypothetical protein SO019_00855 [Lachnospiraceae bacterium]|nr:hypothetical protein [Lachnospiraceae bacterium]
MENTWRTEFHDISVCYTEQLVQIKTDEKLLAFLKKPRRDATALSEYMKKTYEEIFGKELKISVESMAIELLIHLYADEFVHGIEYFGKFLPLYLQAELETYMQKMERRTEVIDSGEAEIDPDRKFFDRLVPYRDVLYTIWDQWE